MYRRKNNCNCNGNGNYGNYENNGYNMVSTRDESIRNAEQALNNGGTPSGVVRNFNNNNNTMNGENYNIGNSNNFNNYYNRYNNYNVTDVNYVRNYVQDINVIHYNTETVNMGTQYMGSRTIIADDSCNNNNSNNPCKKSCKCNE